MSTDFPMYMLLPECGFARHDQHHLFTALRRHCLDVSLFLSRGVTVFQHHDRESCVTSPSHRIQDGCRRQHFGDRISDSAFLRSSPPHRSERVLRLLRDWQASHVVSQLGKIRPPNHCLVHELSCMCCLRHPTTPIISTDWIYPSADHWCKP